MDTVKPHDIVVVLVILTVLTGPIRLAARWEQWRRSRSGEAPLARFWTHRLWIIYDTVMVIGAVFFLSLEIQLIPYIVKEPLTSDAKSFLARWLGIGFIWLISLVAFKDGKIQEGGRNNDSFDDSFLRKTRRKSREAGHWSAGVYD